MLLGTVTTIKISNLQCPQRPATSSLLRAKTTAAGSQHCWPAARPPTFWPRWPEHSPCCSPAFPMRLTSPKYATTARAFGQAVRHCLLAPFDRSIMFFILFHSFFPWMLTSEKRKISERPGPEVNVCEELKLFLFLSFEMETRARAAVRK